MTNYNKKNGNKNRQYRSKPAKGKKKNFHSRRYGRLKKSWKRRWERCLHRWKDFWGKAVKISIIIFIFSTAVFVFTGGRFESDHLDTQRKTFLISVKESLLEESDKIKDSFKSVLEDSLSQFKRILRSAENIFLESGNEAGIPLDQIPDYFGEPYVVLCDNEPLFTDEEIKDQSFEYYSELDMLNRCGPATASIGTDIMPKEERGPIGMVRPSGWKLVKYDIVDGKYLYNRCHLIGFQLTGENANEKNLITGTRAMNVEGMLPFENQVAEYVKKTGNHVMYRVTPVYEGDNLVASGVRMEAYSVEDQGNGVKFHVYVYNNQPGIEIDYSNGESWLLQ